MFWITKDAKFIHAVNKDSDQTWRMRRRIRLVVGSESTFSHVDAHFIFIPQHWHHYKGTVNNTEVLILITEQMIPSGA